MTDEHATADDTPTERDGERNRRSERPSEDPTSDSSTEFGITDEDMEQIRSFLAKGSHRRSTDDLRPSKR